MLRGHLGGSGEAAARERRAPSSVAGGARERAIDALKRMIVMNEVAPGEALTELGLAARLGVSQGTVREALLRLQEDGLVRRRGHRGTEVTDLSKDEALELLDLRKRLETRAAIRAARRAGDADHARLADILARMKLAARARDEYRLTALDIEFHLALFRIAGLPALEQILLRAMLHTQRWKLWAPVNRRSLAATAERHRDILDCLAARDGAGLARALAHHLDTIVEN